MTKTQVLMEYNRSPKGTGPGREARLTTPRLHRHVTSVPVGGVSPSIPSTCITARLGPGLLLQLRVIKKDFHHWGRCLGSSAVWLFASPLSLRKLQVSTYWGWASLVVQMVKKPAVLWSLGWGDPLARKWQPTPVFLPGNFHGQRSHYSPWGHKESDMTKRLIPPPNTHTHRKKRIVREIQNWAEHLVSQISF